MRAALCRTQPISRLPVDRDGPASGALRASGRLSEVRVRIRHTPGAIWFGESIRLSRSRCEPPGSRPNEGETHHGSDASLMMNGYVGWRLLRSRASAVITGQPSRPARAT